MQYSDRDGDTGKSLKKIIESEANKDSGEIVMKYVSKTDNKKYDNGKYEARFNHSTGELTLYRHGEVWADNPLYSKLFIADIYETEKKDERIAMLEMQNFILSTAMFSISNIEECGLDDKKALRKVKKEASKILDIIAERERR